jgi:hypothetical protein
MDPRLLSLGERAVFERTSASMCACKQAGMQTNKQTSMITVRCRLPSPIGLKSPPPWGKRLLLLIRTRVLDAARQGRGFVTATVETERGAVENFATCKQISLYVSMQACKQSSLCQPKLSP